MRSKYRLRPHLSRTNCQSNCFKFLKFHRVKTNSKQTWSCSNCGWCTRNEAQKYKFVEKQTCLNVVAAVRTTNSNSGTWIYWMAKPAWSQELGQQKSKARDTRNRNWYQKLARVSVNLVPDSSMQLSTALFRHRNCRARDTNRAMWLGGLWLLFLLSLVIGCFS